MDLNNPQIANRVLICVAVSLMSSLKDLTMQIDRSLNEAEDLGPSSIIFFHIVGPEPGCLAPPWPGAVNIQDVTKWERILRRIERVSLTTAAFLEGNCSLLALEILMVVDYRIASNSFTCQCAVSGGSIWPGMVVYRLCREVGGARARKLFCHHVTFTAALGLQENLLDKIVDTLPAAFEQIAQFGLDAPMADFAIRRRLFQDSHFTGFDEALGTHLAACERTLRSPDVLNNAATSKHTTQTML